MNYGGFETVFLRVSTGIEKRGQAVFRASDRVYLPGPGE
jgi:hypothetical protein